ncbi:MAG TPA: SLC13 family permease [Acidimicrobiia bacterium]|nr:SLC13 family permease [Acidimicrobiia bacterium]
MSENGEEHRPTDDQSVTGYLRSEQTDGWTKLFVVAPLALLVGVVVAVLAPDDWRAGEGSTTVRFQGVEVTEPVVVGDDDPIEVSGAFGGVEVGLSYPNGIPPGAPVEAEITIREDGIVIEPGLDEVSLTLTLPDGRVEPVPVASWDAASESLNAVRRPANSAKLVFGLLAFVVVMWVTEAVPLFVTSLLIPVALVVGRVASPVDATAPFANPIIVLFFAGFLMAEAMKRSGLDHWVSVNITARVGRSARFLFGGMLALAAFLSMWMSNTAAAAVLIPIAMAVTEPLRHPGFRRALVLGIAYASTIGGVGSAIGTPANQLAIEFLGEFGGRRISFVEWFGFGLPMVVLFLPVMGVYLWWRSEVRIDPGHLEEVRRVASVEKAELGRPRGDQTVVLAVFALVAMGWLTETWHSVHPGLVALAGAVALFAVRRLEPEDLGRISWPALLTFGGGLTLGLALVDSGASDFVATRLSGLAGLPELVALFLVAGLALLLTTVASNTASAAILIPMAIPLAAVVGVSPTIMVVVVAIASSVDFALVIGTPPTMIAYSTRMYTAGQILRRGAALDIVGIVLLTVVVTWVWELFGLA